MNNPLSMKATLTREMMSLPSCESYRDQIRATAKELRDYSDAPEITAILMVPNRASHAEWRATVELAGKALLSELWD